MDASYSKVSYAVPFFVMSVHELVAKLRRSGSTMRSVLSSNGMIVAVGFKMCYPVLLLSHNLEQYVIKAGSLRIWSSFDVEGSGRSVLGALRLHTSIALA